MIYRYDRGFSLILSPQPDYELDLQRGYTRDGSLFVGYIQADLPESAFNNLTDLWKVGR
jgi:hypothetical protein